MAPSPRKSAATAVVLLLVILTADSSESFVDGCNEHLSGTYSGVCFAPFSDVFCRNACTNESSNNLSGKCSVFQCWCYTACDSKIVAPAGAPIRP
ncbi:unnamed protein product [Urochloa decumbens]|uniref:Knottins-like domain-containing protein n=1 Tax=Urochloa decumbens TaxID=240449 RepID=A0ABC9ASG1_9POAL